MGARNRPVSLNPPESSRAYHGRKVMLHLCLGNKESYPNWLEFLRDMVRRGLRTPVLITTAGAPGRRA